MTLRIYLVEDHQRIRDQLIPMLQELPDCRVVGVAESEADACHWLNNNQAAWDLVIADLFLQEGSGLAVLRCCRDRRPQQRVCSTAWRVTANYRVHWLMFTRHARCQIAPFI